MRYLRVAKHFFSVGGSNASIFSPEHDPKEYKYCIINVSHLTFRILPVKKKRNHERR